MGSLGILSTLTPGFLFSNVIYKSNPDTIALLIKARRYRKQRKLNLAKTTYEQVLAIDPTEVRAYNGIRKILLNKKNKEFEVIQLYRQALTHLPNNLRIKRSLHNEYFKAALGNKKVLQQINIPGRMLIHVKERYEEMIVAYPEKKNLQKQLEKIEKYIQLNVDTENPHNNRSLKAYRKQQRKNHKKRFDELPAQMTTLMLAELVAKPISDDREMHIREMAKVNIKALRTEKRYSEALLAAENFLNTKNASDPHFIKQFRDLAKQLNQYDKLIMFESQNHQLKNTYWSAVSLFDAHNRKADNQSQSAPLIMDSLVVFMTEKLNDPNQLFELNTRKIKLDLLKNNFPQAREKIVIQCKEMMGISATHYIDRMNVIIANYYRKIQDDESRNAIVSIAMNPRFYFESDDEMKKSIAIMNMRRSYDNPIHIQNLQKKLASL